MSNERIKTVSRTSAKRRIILKICTIFVLLCSTTAFAFAPAAVYWASFLTASAVGFLASQAHTNGATGRTIGLYASRGLNFAFKNQNAITYDDFQRGMDGDVYQAAYAIPVGSRNGVALTLNTPARDVAKQMTDNPSQYPNTNQAINEARQAGAYSASGDNNTWGSGTDFNSTAIPEVGDWVCNPNGGRCGQITSVINQDGSICYWPLGRVTWHNANSFSIYTGWNGNCVGSNNKPGRGRGRASYHLSENSSLPPATDKQLVESLQANPAEVGQAQRDLYQSKNNGPPSGSAGTATNPWTGEKFPSAAGGGVVTYPGSSQQPTAAEILGAVDAADAATSDSGVSRPNADELPPPVTTTTTQTRTRGEVTVTTDPETGARTVSYPTTVRTIDAAGNVVDEQIEYFVGTYPAGTAFPAEVQAAVDGVSQSVTTAKTSTQTLPANLTKPDLVPINWDGFLVAIDAMRDRFPFSILAGVVTFLDSFYVEPETPHFTMVLHNEEFEFSMEWLDTLALLWRRMIKAVILAFTAYFCLNILMR